jgi:hypothetical protein
MPSKFNSEFNYRYLVNGETPWEKIKILKGFLEGRKRAACLEEVAAKKRLAKELELENCKNNNALPHVILNLEAELLESKSFDAGQEEAWELNRQEIAFLENYLAEIYEIAEPTRIPGYTDEQMFEANAAYEFTVMLGKEIQAEIIANGRPSPAKLRNAMSNPYTFETLKRVGLVPQEAVLLDTAVTNPLELAFNEVVTETKNLQIQHFSKVEKE